MDKLEKIYMKITMLCITIIMITSASGFVLGFIWVLGELMKDLVGG